MKRIDPVTVLQRLRILELKLENEGQYVRANTCYLAIQFVLQTMGEECARQLQKEDEERTWEGRRV